MSSFTTAAATSTTPHTAATWTAGASVYRITVSASRDASSVFSVPALPGV